MIVPLSRANSSSTLEIPSLYQIPIPATRFLLVGHPHDIGATIAPMNIC